MVFKMLRKSIKDMKIQCTIVYFTGDGELRTVTWNPFWNVPPIPSTMMKNTAFPRIWQRNKTGACIFTALYTKFTTFGYDLL